MTLLERDEATGTIEAALESAARGHGDALLLHGAPGIGKTSLLEFGMHAARAAGFRVAAAVGSPMEAELPFGLLGQAIVALGGSDVEDVVDPARLGGQPARFYRTFRWLDQQARDTPLLLALDDLHWGDRDSLELLAFLARRLAGTRILVLGSLRPEPDRANEIAQELAASGHAQPLRLAPLSLESASSLLAGLVGRPLEDSERERIWRVCAGTPLLLEQAAWSLVKDGRLELSERGGPTGALLLRRFVGLGSDAYAYVRAACIFGVRFDASLAAALAGLEQAAGRTAHTRLVRAGLLEELGGGRAAFVHPLFAQALLEGHTPNERERLHAEAFRMLVADGAPDALACEHALAARLHGDALAVEVAARAGRAALGQGALESAGTLLAGAVELAGERAEDALLLDHASALAARARIDDAREVCEGLLARAGLAPALRARVLALLARAQILASSPREAERRYEEAATAAAQAGGELEAELLAEAAITCQVSSPVAWVIETATRALAAMDREDPRARRMASLRAYAALLGGDPSGEALLEQERGRFAARARDSDEGWGWTMAVHSLNGCKVTEDFDGASEVFEREFDRAVEDGAPILINALAVAFADTLHRLGRPREGLELVRRANALSGMTMAPWTDLAQAVLLTELGEDAEASLYIGALRAFKEKVPPEYHAPVSLWLHLLDVRRLLAAGEPRQASREALDAAETARLTGWLEPCVVPWVGVGVEAHLAAGRLDLARALVEQLERISEPLSCRWPRAALEIGRARVAAAEGAGKEADERFARALATLEQLPMPIARAEALVAQGSHLRRDGRPREAREPLALALSLAEECQAERLARLARAELAACGGRRRRRGEDAHELTAQERRVSELAASGMTNVQIAAALHLSPKTVGHHLQHVYAKLGIGSRRELIRGASEQRIPAREPADKQ
jgi:DNA-binding CsgD family transcriptional regulator